MSLIPARPTSTSPPDSTAGQRRHRRRGLAVTAWLAMTTVVASGLAVIPVSVADATDSSSTKSAVTAAPAEGSGTPAPPVPENTSGDFSDPPVNAEPATTPTKPTLAAKAPAPAFRPGPVQGFVAGKSVEDRSARTATAETFANPDGTHTTRISSVPVHYFDGKAWQDIDNSIVTDPAHPGMLRNKANGFVARFAPIGNGISVDADGTSFTMAPQGVRLRTASPTVQADSKTVLYQG